MAGGGGRLGYASDSPASGGPPPGGPPSGQAAPATYRHLLSAGSLHPANPLRVIAHCDVDAAYAQFEAARLGIDSFAVPLAVQQWQGLIAVSYKARDFGIGRHCDIDKARTLCPELVAVHVQTIAPGASEAAYNDNPRPQTHKVSLDPYRRESRKILAVFKQTCPLGQVEKASIDESYFDLTLEVRKLILARYPHLAKYPPTSKGMDELLPAPPLIDWDDDSGELIPLKGPDAAREDGEGDDGGPSDLLASPTWTDVALAHGAYLMARVRREVRAALGYTTSAGIASNKTLAKLCSGYRKPNQQSTLLPRSVPAFLRDLPVSKIRFLGGKLGREIGEMWDANTVGDLWSVPLASMQTHFGPEAHWVYAVLRGVDHSPVSARIANKTMLASKNLRPAIRRPHEALTWLDMLATELVVRIREVWEDEQVAADTREGEEISTNRTGVAGSKSKEKSGAGVLLPTIWPKFLVLRFIRAGADGGPRSRQAPFPYVNNLAADVVYRVAERLWYEACDEMRLGQKPLPGSTADADRPIEIVTVSLGFSGLERAEIGQKTIEGFFGRAGHKRGREGTDDKNNYDTGINQSTASANDADYDGAKDASVRWTCEECGDVIRVALPAPPTTLDVSSPEALTTPPVDPTDGPQTLHEASFKDSVSAHEVRALVEHQLAIQVQDHRDWHFAVKLSAAPDDAPQSTSAAAPALPPPGGPPLKKQKAPKKGSLQSFFAKQQP